MTNLFPPTTDDTRKWCEFTVGFVAGCSDDDTVGSMLERFEGYTVRITAVQQVAPADVSLLDANVIVGTEAGIRVLPVDENAQPLVGAVPVWISYRDLRSIDVY